MDFDIYVERLIDIWKKNILENLKTEELEFALTRDFLAELKREFGREDNKLTKVVELKNIEQGTRIIVEFVQEFRKVAK